MFSSSTTSSSGRRILLAPSTSKSKLNISPSGVVSPYTAALHGPTRAPAARTLPPTPYDLWLQCRNSIAPFKESCLVVGCKEHEADAELFKEKAGEHFRNVLDYRFSLEANKKNPLLSSSSISSSPFLTSSSTTSNRHQNRVSDSYSHQKTNKTGGDEQKHIEEDEQQSVQDVVADYCSASGKNGLDAVILSPSCTAPYVPLSKMGSINIANEENPSSSVSSSSTTNYKPKLLSNSQDLFFAFETFCPFIRPHGVLCLTGTDLLSSSELVCADSVFGKSTRQDWRDMCEYLNDQMTPEEQYLTLIKDDDDEKKKKNDPSASSSSVFFDQNEYQQIKQISQSFGFVNMTYYEFETEYPLDTDFKFLSGIIRRIPSYRRMIERQIEVERNDDRCDEYEQQQDPIFSQRRGSGSNGGDPLEYFVELARSRRSSLSSIGGIPELVKKSRENDVMRLKLKHWMWVCDRRPRSKDSISFASRKRKS